MIPTPLDVRVEPHRRVLPHSPEEQRTLTALRETLMEADARMHLEGTDEAYAEVKRAGGTLGAFLLDRPWLK